MQFPIAERTDRLTVNGAVMTFTRKDNDVVDVEPKGQVAPLYQRGHYRQGETRWREADRFVAGRIIDW
jgi:hypothetical protein